MTNGCLLLMLIEVPLFNLLANYLFLCLHLCFLSHVLITGAATINLPAGRHIRMMVVGGTPCNEYGHIDGKEKHAKMKTEETQGFNAGAHNGYITQELSLMSNGRAGNGSPCESCVYILDSRENEDDDEYDDE